MEWCRRIWGRQVPQVDSRLAGPARGDQAAAAAGLRATESLAIFLFETGTI